MKKLDTFIPEYLNESLEVPAKEGGSVRFL